MSHIKYLHYIIVFFLVLSKATAQTLVWTGSADNDFFNEQNWIIQGSQNAPDQGSIEPNAAINYNLMIKHAALDISGKGPITFGSSQQSLQLTASTFACDGLTTGLAKVGDTSTFILNAPAPLGNQGTINITDNYSWLKLIKVNPYVADTVYLNKIQSSGNAAVLGTNIRINQYYEQGCLVRRLDSDFEPLTLFDGAGQSGSTFGVKEFVVYSDAELGDFNNVASSFRLERGFMVNVAIYQNGKGKSQVYIASEKALEVDLPQALDNSISFVRVVPWNWVTKKGASSFVKGLHNSWTYNWGNGAESLPNTEYAPMSWGGGGATTSSVYGYREMQNITHVMGFNESDNCSDQSGQYGGLCQIDIAVPTYGNLPRSGLRLVSPSCRENAPFGWLSDFTDLAKQSDVRYDVVGIHWYDWGGKPTQTPYEDPQKVFERFKNYLQKVYDRYQMPIWITEFNANANRDSTVQIGFIKLAIPYLESLDYIERYDYFEPNPNIATTSVNQTTYYDAAGNLTAFGKIYASHQSTPSIPEDTWSAPTFLADMDSKVSLDFKLSMDSVQEGQSITVTVTTAQPVGAPQTLSVVVSNLDDQRYSIANAQLNIPEGGTTAETTIITINDDLVQEPVTATVSLTGLSGGITWSGSDQNFVLMSEDVKKTVLDVKPQRNISIRPNPASSNLLIDNQPEKATKVTCTSLDGRVFSLKPSSAASYGISHLENGVYILTLYTSDSKVYHQKLIIQK